jgi:hypothetical protein
MFRDVSDHEFDQHLRNLSAYGYTVAKSYMPQETVRMLLEKTWHYYDKTKDYKYAGRPERDLRDLRVYSLQNKDMLYIEILGAPFVRRVLMDKLNDPYYRWIPGDKPNYILQNFNARSSGNALDLHIDSRVPLIREKPISLQVIYALEDMDDTNGCSVVAPGTHNSGRYTDRELENVVPLHAKAGDLVIWDSRLWHGTQASNGNKSRWALIASFCMWWMKQDLNMIRTLPEEFYARMTDEQKQLIGYLSIPPDAETERINVKCGYDFLKPKVADYFRASV